jgi:uncharacterized membrane protein YdjX (TVP38/TMEM64 family)
MGVIDTKSQLDQIVSEPVLPARTVAIDLYPDSDSVGCDGADCTGCDGCSGASSFANAATCAMVGASSRNERPKTLGARLTIQMFYWSIMGIAAIVSLKTLIPVMSDPMRAWVHTNILSNGAGRAAAWVLAIAFAIGFVHKLGRDRINGGCAMIRRLGPATILGVAWSTLPSFAGVMLVLNMEPIRIALIGDGSTPQLMLGLAIYTSCFIVLAGFGCLPTVSQAILAGYAFGVTLGLPAALIGFGGASLIGYELVQRVARRRVEMELNRSPRIVMIRDALLTASPRRAVLLVTLLRASPSAPFALTNLVLGCLGVPRWVFFFGTIFGMLPRTLAAVLIGVSFTGWNGGFDQPRWIVIAGIVATIAALIVISKVAASTLIRLSRSDEHAQRELVSA